MIEREIRAGVSGARLDAQLAAEFAAELAPQLHEGAECVAGWLQQHAAEAALGATRRQRTAEFDAVPCVRSDLEVDAAGGAAAAAGCEAHVIVDHQIEGCGRGGDFHLPAGGVGVDPEFHGLKIHHERIG